MSDDYKHAVHLESALSVAHDLIDTVSRLKADNKFLEDGYTKFNDVISERQRQIEALTYECSVRDDKIKFLEASLENAKADTESKRLDLVTSNNDCVSLMQEREALMNTVRELKHLIKSQEATIFDHNRAIETHKNEAVMWKTMCEDQVVRMKELGEQIIQLKEQITLPTKASKRK